MIHIHRHKDPQRKVSPPGPTYMSSDQVASYLKDLRTNRPPRPNGSRPLPSKAAGSASESRERLPPRASSALSTTRSREGSTENLVGEAHPRSASTLSHHRTTSQVSVGSSAGRPLVQQPDAYYIRRTMSPNAKVAHRFSAVSPSGIYRESGQRWLERQEARSLRDALAEMDLQEERRIHAAAQEEATRLVWEHRNPGVPYKDPYAPYRNPDLDARNRYRQGSHARRQTVGGHENYSSTSRESRPASDSSGEPSSPESNHDTSTTKDGTSKKKGKVNFALPPEDTPVVKGRGSATSRSRTASGDSSKGVFRNPEDSIYEEPEELNSQTEQNNSAAPSPSALKVKPRNSLPDRSSTLPYNKRYSPVEIHKNPPSQSKNPQYTINPPPTPPSPDSKGEDAAPTKNGLEIRSEEIRAATSMKLKDRSPKLPMPTAVSNRPGQPIVSFDPNWKPKEEQPKKIDDKPKPPVPTINLPGESKDPTPSISVSPPKTSADEPTGRSRPLPDPAKSRRQTPPDPQKMPPASERNWYSPFTRTGVPSASCTTCRLPISGRVVTAAGARFHPECFTCYHCKTQLECVAFYQEPEAKRAERLANASADDEEAKAMRFYCHLDFHELFSPRCKSCKTPIEGEVVVACGAEWHVGHFFCAECGDPFTQETPFVEKDGFAWCLRCHSRRTAARCLGCKQPILDEVVVTALGGQWHDKCFVCHECGNNFGPEGRFFVKEGEPKRSAKGRIIGGPVQLAVCEKCEAIRLKSSH
ncbi:hypothetical protein VTN77DRAFT_6693 [Rasamsonia byssochlamydoides]|uniref:uncharacterized protein n=1 Tax=Rasamsonia byssochlamydoides TaxID=89139 RepID=UPI003744313B